METRSATAKISGASANQGFIQPLTKSISLLKSELFGSV